MRKVFAILAVCCLFIITGGYQLLNHLRISEAKREMKKVLLTATSDQLISFTFSQTELAKLAWEDDSEFELDGEMYDVVKKEQSNNKTIVWCISDKKETALIDQYIKTEKQSSQKKAAIFKLLSIQFIPCEQNVFSLTVNTERRVFDNYLLFIPYSENSILTPPPRLS